MVYLDNAATTFPKPEEVYQKMDWANRNMAVNAGRGSYHLAREASKIIDETRKMLVEVVQGVGVEKAILTPSATIALHIILNGIDFQKGDTVFLSPYEHNAVARTMERISIERGIKVVELPLVKETLEIDIEKTRYMFLKNRPKCVCCTHVSNVTGYILPVSEIFQLAKEYNSVTVLDASQSFGLVDIDVKSFNADFVVFAGHKTLYGPFGAAGFIENTVMPLNISIAGGTGSDSLNLSMPLDSPERYEAASKDIVAIAGLNEALKVLDVQGNYKKEKELTVYTVGELKNINGVKLYAPVNPERHIGVISFNVEGYKAEDIGLILDEDFDIAVRTGYHCAPYIHKYLNDLDYLGSVRIGVGKYNSKGDIDCLLKAINEISGG
jgi:cysteine desulfurase family protein